MTLHLLLFCFIASLICVAVHEITKENHILFWFRRMCIMGDVPSWMCTVTYECLPCMSGLYTILLWLFEYQSVSWYLPLAILITCGFNVIIAFILAAVETLSVIASYQIDQDDIDEDKIEGEVSWEK